MTIFKKAKENAEAKKQKMTKAEEQFNKMWDLWTKGDIPSPYADLMTYYNEVNNGGHRQFFLNVSNTGHLDAVIAELDRIVPFDIKLPLVDAYHAYRVNGKGAEENENFFDHADEVFEKKGKLIDEILEDYSRKF